MLARQSADQIFLAARFRRVRGVADRNLVAIENEIFAVLVEQRHAVEPQCVAQNFRRGFRLLDNADQRLGTGDGHCADLRGSAHFFEKRVQFAAELLRIFDRGRERRDA